MVDKVGLIHTKDFDKYDFGRDHPLRPLRLKLTYDLMEKLNLLENPRLEILEPRLASKAELERVHSKKYINIIKTLSDNPDDRSISPYLYGLGPGDNPIFKGMYEASALISGGTIIAADKVWRDDDIKVAFNPMGGLHHAMREKASGFCIFNDIAVGIKHLKTLNKEIRIAYLDIDCHHGDGVQWLFYDDPNVLTISYHQDGRYLFPGTGFVSERGEGKGKGYSINFPLIPGTNNKSFLKLFRKTAPKLLEAYSPDLLITQLGVDTYYDDPLTQMGFSLSVYKDIAQTMKTSAREYCQNKWLALGGGGYLMTVVPRAWTLALQVMLDENPLPNTIPLEWIDYCEKKITDEEIPYELRDTNYRVEEQLVKNPMFSVRIEQRLNEIEEFVYNKVLPNI